jgi:hypothetical protein
MMATPKISAITNQHPKNTQAIKLPKHKINNHKSNSFAHYL